MKKILHHRLFEATLNNSFVILATVVGVYLAAQAGFEKAIEFELARSDRDSYYLRKSLLDEFVDNLDMIERWGTDFTTGGAKKYIGHPEKYQLDTFVWETMKRSADTFEIPTQILSKVRRYYLNTNLQLTKMTAVRPDRKTVDAMIADTRETRLSVVPLMERDLELLVDKLKGYKIEDL